MNVLKRVSVIGFLCAGCTALGAGFQLYTEGSAEALGLAGAISGRTNLTSLAWYNPSALAGADRAQVMAGNSFVLIRTKFNSDVAPSLNSEMDDDWRSIPHFYYVHPVNERVTGTLSMNAAYGLISEWPDLWAGAAAATYSELSTFCTTPSVAFKVTDSFSLSVGFNVVYAKAELRAARGQLGERKLTGDDVGYGYTASAHWQMTDDWALGARYQSRVDLQLEGDVEYGGVPGATYGTEADLTLPSSMTIGLANNSFEKLHLGLDVIWTEWSTYQALVFEFPDNVYEDPVQTLPKRWKDAWSVRIGGEYELSESWVLRGCYVRDLSPVPDATRSPELPGSDRHMLMSGLGWKGERIGIDLSYSYLWASTSRTGSEVTALIPTTAGEYASDSHIIAISLGYSF